MTSVGDRDRTKERDQLRRDMLADGATYAQIATAMTQQFQDRPRPAWRQAYGWTQQHVADLYNRETNDPSASMTAHRISDFERWPVSESAAKPVIPTLGVLAKIYSTRISKLLDHHDRQKMAPAELITCAILDSGVIPPHQLPATVPNFVGRSYELVTLTARLDRLKAAGKGSPVVITSIGGTAGIGKTSLAVYWARAHIDHFPDGQLYADLRGFSPSGNPVAPQEAIRGFLDAFQVPPEKIPPSLDAQTALYRTLVEGRRLVIVLDNVRDPDQVRPLLPSSPTCMVLITSRQQLGSLIGREQATHIALDFLTTVESRQLLTNLIGTERIQAEPEAVDELIYRCIGLPIALTIAAARIQAEPHTSLSTLVGQLRQQRQRLDALATGDSQLTNIRAVFFWSYAALTPRAARLFRLLSLHPGPDIVFYAAASLAGVPEPDTHGILAELTRMHLLEERVPSRYQFHDLLRVYATEQAAKKESDHQRQLAIRRVLDYYLHTSIAANQHLNPHRVPIAVETVQPGVISNQVKNHEEASEWFTTEHEVLLAATNLAARSGLYAHAWQLPWALSTFLHRWGHWHDYAATQHIAVVAAADHPGDRAAQALALRLLGHAYTHLERYADALTYLQQALIQYQNLGDRDGQARTHLSLSMVCERQNQYAEALTHAKQAFNLYRITGNRIWQARALNNVGWYHALLGLYQETIIHCQQALILHHELGDRMGVANTLDSLGYADYHLGRHDHALTCYQQSITSWQELGHHYHEARSLARLSETHHATGNYSAARNTWQQALAILDRLRHPDAKHFRTKLANFNPPGSGACRGQKKSD